MPQEPYSELLAYVHSKLLQSCLILCDPMDYNRPDSSCQWDSPGKNTGMGCHFLLQEISSRPRSWTQVSCIAGRFFTTSTTWEALQNSLVFCFPHRFSSFISVPAASWLALPALEKLCPIMYVCMYILDWQTNLFGFFHKMLQNNLK